jgi:hypothetical protein
VASTFSGAPTETLPSAATSPPPSNASFAFTAMSGRSPSASTVAETARRSGKFGFSPGKKAAICSGVARGIDAFALTCLPSSAASACRSTSPMRPSIAVSMRMVPARPRRRKLAVDSSGFGSGARAASEEGATSTTRPSGVTSTRPTARRRSASTVVGGALGGLGAEPGSPGEPPSMIAPCAQT